MLPPKQRKLIEHLKPVQLGSRRRLKKIIDPTSPKEGESPVLKQTSQTQRGDDLLNGILISNEMSDPHVGESFNNIGNALHQQTNSVVNPITNVNLNMPLTSTLNRNSIDPIELLLNNQQSLSNVETINESKQGQSIQLVNELEAAMMPTMLEVNFEKPRLKERIQKVARVSTRANLNSLTRQTVKTDGLSGSSLGGLISVQGTVAPMRPESVLIHAKNAVVEMARNEQMQRAMSPTQQNFNVFSNGQGTQGPNETAKNEIINNINLAFDQLKSLFPQKKQPQNRSQVARSKKRNIGAILSNNRANSCLSKNSTSYSRTKSQQVTTRQNRVQSAQGISSFQKHRQQVPKTTVLTSNVPTQRQDSTTTHLCQNACKPPLPLGKSHFSTAQQTAATTAIRNLPRPFSQMAKSGNYSRQMHTSQEIHSKNFPRKITDADEEESQSQKSKVSIYQMDSKKLLSFAKQTYHKKTVADKGPSQNKYIKNGPIKRLKSAMIRSVFDHGEAKNKFINMNQDYNYGEDQVIGSRGSSPKRKSVAKGAESRQHIYGGTHSSQYSDAELMKQQSTKGQQINFPTYTATTPLDFNGSEMHMSNINSRQLASAIHQLEKFQNQTISSNGKNQDSYQNLIFGDQKKLAEGLDSSNLQTPENEPFVMQAVVGIYGSQNIENTVQQAEQKTDKKEFSEATFMQQFGTSQERCLKTGEDEAAAQRVEVQFTQETFQPANDGQVLSEPDVHALRSGRSNNAELSEQKVGKEHIIQIRDINRSGEERFVRTQLLSQGVSPNEPISSQSTSQQNLHTNARNHEEMRISTKSENETVPLGSVADSGEQRLHKSSGNNELLVQGLVSVVKQQMGNNDAQAKNFFIHKGEVQLTPQNPFLEQHKFSEHEARKTVITEVGHNFSQGGTVSDNEQVAHNRTSLLSSGYSHPQLVSKLNSDGEFKIQEAVGPRHNESSHHALSQDSTWNNLKQQMGGVRDFELAQMRRDQFLLAMLKQQIEEEQMQMYDLNYGLESGMIKTDPLSMNKVILNMVTQQQERWQRIFAENLHLIEDPAILFPGQESSRSEQRITVAYKGHTPENDQFTEIRVEKQASGDQKEVVAQAKSTEAHTRTLSQSVAGDNTRLAAGLSKPQRPGQIVVKMGKEKVVEPLAAISAAPYYQHLFLAGIGQASGQDGAYNTNNESSNYLARGITEEADDGSSSKVKVTTPMLSARDARGFDLADTANGGTASRLQNVVSGCKRDDSAGELMNIKSNNQQNLAHSEYQNNQAMFVMGSSASTPPATTSQIGDRIAPISANDISNKDLVEDFVDRSHSREKLLQILDNKSNVSFEDPMTFQPAGAREDQQLNLKQFTPRIKEPMKKFLNFNEQTKIPERGQSILQQNETKIETKNETIGPLYQKQVQTAPFYLVNNHASQTSSPGLFSPNASSGAAPWGDYATHGNGVVARPRTALNSRGFVKEPLAYHDSLESKNLLSRLHPEAEVYGQPRGSLRNIQGDSLKGSREKILLATKRSGLNQAIFNQIDVEKLTSDKLLNRHIHGQTQSQYNFIKQEAKQRVAESNTTQLVVLNQRDRTMISQQSANMKMLRNNKFWGSRASSKQQQSTNKQSSSFNVRSPPKVRGSMDSRIRSSLVVDNKTASVTQQKRFESVKSSGSNLGMNPYLQPSNTNAAAILSLYNVNPGKLIKQDPSKK